MGFSFLFAGLLKRHDSILSVIVAHPAFDATFGLQPLRPEAKSRFEVRKLPSLANSTVANTEHRICLTVGRHH